MASRDEDLPSDAEPAPQSVEDEQLYDAYQELLLQGELPDPDAFLAGRPDAEGGRDELREALRGLHRLAVNARRCIEPDGAVESLPYERLGDFRLLARLGSGGMGLVFLAEQESLGRRVALKILRPEWSSAPAAAARFRREAQAIARLRHPNIVQVLAAGEERGVRWFAMDLVEGESLEELLRADGERSAARSQRVRWVLEIAHALEHAHAHGLVHRDVKPANIRIAPDGRALLVDFGLVLDDAAGGAATLTQGFAGSPAYASPEQIRSTGSVDARTDVYSLGVTLYECLTGRRPHEAASAQDVLLQIVSADPPAPRRLDATIPRDLETVTVHALEKDPARRYAGAAEFARDLEAVLELRPIAARPPGWGARTMRRARRHPALAAAALTALLGALATGALAWEQARRGGSARAAEARAAVAEARQRVATYKAGFEALGEIEREVSRLRSDLEYSYLTPAQDALLASQERAMVERRRERETAFYEVLDLLRHAERLDPRATGTDELRAALYLERYREARNTGDREAARFYRERVEALDSERLFANDLRGDLRGTFESEPPGAELFLYRYEEQWRLRPDGEAREVPVPIGRTESGSAAEAPELHAEPLEPGTFGLRLEQGTGELLRGDFIVELAGQPIRGAVFALASAPPTRAGDRLIEVDGSPSEDIEVVEATEVRGEDPQGERTYRFARKTGAGVELHERRGQSLAGLGIVVGSAAELASAGSREPLACRVRRGDALFDAELPAETVVRASAATPVLDDRARAGATPVELPLEAGDYLGVLRLEGFEDQRFTLRVEHGHGRYTCRVPLLPRNATPSGYVRVVCTSGSYASLEPYWIQDREVVAAEYLEFLNDPRTQAEIDASSEPIRVPRYGEPRTATLLWERSESGRYTLPGTWRADWPALAVSYADALAYARWLTERAASAGSDEVYTLPTEAEFEFAGHGGLTRHYAYGRTFRPKWARTCFAKPSASPGPVLRFPLDESPFGVFDLGGSVFEWIDAPWGSDGASRRLAGGAWGRSDPEMLKIEGGIGAVPEVTTGETGFRLVMRRRRPEQR